MSEKLSRRNFLKLLSVAPVVPYISTEATNIVAEVDFGFTWGVVKAPIGFDEIIKATLKTRTKELSESLTSKNSLLLKLQDNNYVKINKIDPEVQAKRILDKTQKRVRLRDEKHKNQPAFQEWRRKPAKTNIYYTW